MTGLAELFHNADTWVLERVEEFDPRPALRVLPFAAAAQLLVLLRRARGALALAEAEVERHVALAMNADMDGARVDERGRFQGVEVPGVGVLVRHTKGGRKGWNHEGVKDALIARLADELPYSGAVNEDGEKVPTAGFLRDVVARWYESAGAAAWKVTGLKALGIDPDDYSQWTPPTGPDAERFTVEVQ